MTTRLAIIDGGDIADVAAVVASLADRGNDAPYPLGPVIEEKCFSDGIAGRAELRIAMEDSDPAGLSVTCGRHLRLLVVDRARRGRGIGSRLLIDAEKRLAARHAAIDVAAEPGNYFTPGVREDDPSTLGFFLHRGYDVRGHAVSLSVALDGFAVENGIVQAQQAERDEILALAEQHFGAGWRFECARAFDVATPTVVIARRGSALAGFAAFEANNRGLGSFGPAGVIASERERGTGGRLARAALASLAALGFTRAIIPWVSDAAFYRKACGAVVDARFRLLQSSISGPA